MKKSIPLIIILLCVFFSCEKEQNPFQIGKQHIGLLTDSTSVKNLKTIFSNDSIVTFISGDEFTGSKNTIDIYEKGGKKLLALTPSRSLDSTSVIDNIQIIDPRYITDKNISILSTFKDLTDNYKISRIDNLINSVVVTVDDIHASFAIDKKELPANLRFNMDIAIEAMHIPDSAKIKYFFINWNNLN
ncbi:hypothetical protein [Changchengzhania lutea]|uniref:hypothetical protein n=1 Tax=Changchengzhania lutea TaxID=2049305 RepID=UPI00115C8733|nr:hypothetical protein [Changchengzhania lutea]